MQQNDPTDQEAMAIAKTHMGAFAWPTVVFALAVILAYVATVTLAVAGIIPLLLAVPLAAILTYLAYTVLHESAHGSISGSNKELRWVNEALGYLAAWVLLLPLTAHRHEHLAHHRNTNEADEDPDHIVSGMLTSPLQFLLLSPRLMWKQFDYYLKNRWNKGPRSQDIALCLEIASALVPRLGIVAAGFWMEGLALFLAAWFAGMYILTFLFAYIVHTPHEATGRYVDTSTILVPGALGKLVTWLWVYQNYHSIHHLFPRVPFYRYPAVFEQIEDAMVAKGAPIYRLGVEGMQLKEAKAI